MAVAVCFQCGTFKTAAFCPCPDCSAVPQDEEEIALSLAMTDCYFDRPALQEISSSIQSGRPPQLDEQTHAKMLEMIHGPEFVRQNHLPDELNSAPKPHLPRLDGADQPQLSDKSPWWKIW